MVAVTFVLVEISPYIIFWNHCDIAEILKVVLNLAGWFLFKFLSASLLVTNNRNSDFWLAKLKNSPIWNLKPPSQLEPKLRGMISDRSPQFPHFILIWQTTWLAGNSCFWMVKLRINMIPLGQWTKLLRNCVWKVFCTQKNYRRLIPLSIWFEVKHSIPSDDFYWTKFVFSKTGVWGNLCRFVIVSWCACCPLFTMHKLIY